jgi:hypothetical protein
MPDAVPPLADMFAVPLSAFESQTLRERVVLAQNRLSLVRKVQAS